MNAIDRPRSQPLGFATAEDWGMFLRPMLAALNSKPSREEFGARCAAIAFAMPRVPVALLTPWRQRESLQRFKFLPSPAEVSEWLAPDLRDDRERAERAERLAPPAPAPAATTRTAEEIAAVSAKVRAFVAEVRDREAQERRPIADRPATLSEGTLIEHYRRLAENGNKAAAFRVQAYEAARGPHG